MLCDVETRCSNVSRVTPKIYLLLKMKGSPRSESRCVWHGYSRSTSQYMRGLWDVWKSKHLTMFQEVTMFSKNSSNFASKSGCLKKRFFNSILHILFCIISLQYQFPADFRCFGGSLACPVPPWIRLWQQHLSIVSQYLKIFTFALWPALATP